MFNDYSDVVTPDDVCKMLNIGKSKAYEILRSNAIKHIRIGSKYVIPKHSVVSFLESCYVGDVPARESAATFKGA